MKRAIAILLSAALLLSVCSASVAAKDHKDSKDDSRVTIDACKKDGWKGLQDADGKPFRSQGQCVSYARHGGEVRGIEPGEDEERTLTVVDDDGESEDSDEKTVAPTATADSESIKDPAVPVLTIVDGQEPWNGYLEGSGFAPGATLTKVTFASDRETLNLTYPVGTSVDDDGTFTTERIIYWCSEFHGYGESSGTVTVELSDGETYSQTFEMETYCGPKE